MHLIYDFSFCQAHYFGGSLDTLSATRISPVKSSSVLGATTNSSGYGSTINGSFDPTPDQTSFMSRGLRNDADDSLRTNRTVSSKESTDLAALVSRSLILRQGINQSRDTDLNQTQLGKREEVNPLLSRCFAANADGTLYEVTERLLLRDVLYVFQGIEGKIILYDPTSDSYKINKDIGVSLPVRDLVGKLAELGWLFRRVQKFLSARAGDKALGLVGQSFCAAIQKELTEYYRLVAVLEGQENQEDAGISNSGAGLTLRRLMIWTFDPLLRMKALATLVDVCKGIAIICIF